MTKLNLIKKAVKSMRAAAAMLSDDFFSRIEDWGETVKIPRTVDGLSVISKTVMQFVSQIQDLCISSSCKSC